MPQLPSQREEQERNRRPQQRPSSSAAASKGEGPPGQQASRNPRWRAPPPTTAAEASPRPSPRATGARWCGTASWTWGPFRARAAGRKGGGGEVRPRRRLAPPTPLRLSGAEASCRSRAPSRCGGTSTTCLPSSPTRGKGGAATRSLERGRRGAGCFGWCRCGGNEFFRKEREKVRLFLMEKMKE